MCGDTKTSNSQNNLETTKLLEENVGSNLFDTGLKNIFLAMSPQAREIIAKINGTTLN